MQGFQAVPVNDRVYWVGAIDWSVRDFHGYSTDRGSTYNAYLIIDEKITLIDTVKAPFADELLARISSVIDPGDIDYVVCNHAEMDHSGALARVIGAVQPEKVFASMMGAKALADHFALDREIVAVEDGETLSLGKGQLTFVETRMLHWPDSMFSYLSPDRVLFSSDAFGMHLASSERFDDEVAGWEYEAIKYYANILLPYSGLVTKLLARVKDSGLDIAVIAPDHGPIWRDDVQTIVGLYGEWAAARGGRKVVVAYDTMWNSTALMARAVGEGLFAQGMEVKLMALHADHRSDIVAELLDAGALVVGSPTLNNNVFPTIADLLTYVKGLKPKHLVGAGFGSYGWSGEAVDQIGGLLKDAKMQVIEPGVKSKYVPDDEVLSMCVDLGTRVAATIEQKEQE